MIFTSFYFMILSIEEVLFILKRTILFNSWRKFPQILRNFRDPGSHGSRIFPCLVVGMIDFNLSTLFKYSWMWTRNFGKGEFLWCWITWWNLQNFLIWRKIYSWFFAFINATSYTYFQVVAVALFIMITWPPWGQALALFSLMTCTRLA